jgi:hypothetical protein
MITNPHLLPKVRSHDLIMATHAYPCELRIASFLGLPCHGDVMAVHIDFAPGKGVATKVTDLAVCAGCDRCHRLLDGRDKAGWDVIRTKYAAAIYLQVIRALVATQARLVADGIITVKGGEVI